MSPNGARPNGFNQFATQKVREAVDIPVMAVGRITPAMGDKEFFSEPSSLRTKRIVRRGLRFIKRSLQIAFSAYARSSQPTTIKCYGNALFVIPWDKTVSYT